MKDMELYDSFIRETTDLLGAPTQKWAYKERDAWKDNGESELVLLRDAAYELGGGANDAVNFTCVTSDSSLVPADEVLLYGPDMKEIRATCRLPAWSSSASRTSTSRIRMRPTLPSAISSS